MSGPARRLTPAQLADVVARRLQGRPDKAAMSNGDRLEAGLMNRQHAAEHERLATLPPGRVADRVRGPVPDDIWAAPEEGAPDAA